MARRADRREHRNLTVHEPHNPDPEPPWMNKWLVWGIVLGPFLVYFIGRWLVG